MLDTALLALLFALAYAGFLLLALSQHQHWQAVFGTTMGHKPLRLRWMGGILLGLSLVTALYRDGPAFGAILWIVVLMIAAGAAVATLTWQTPCCAGSSPVDQPKLRFQGHEAVRSWS